MDGDLAACAGWLDRGRRNRTWGTTRWVAVALCGFGAAAAACAQKGLPGDWQRTLREGPARARRSLVHSVAKAPPANAVAVLLAAIENDYRGIRRFAAQTLAERTDLPDAVGQRLFEMLPRGPVGYNVEASAALERLMRRNDLADSLPRARESIGASSARVRWESLWRLAVGLTRLGIGDQKATLQVMQAGLSDDVRAVRTVAVWALARCGRGPAKGRAAQDDELGQGLSPVPEAVRQGLVRASSDPDLQVRMTALGQLATVPHSVALGILIEALGDAEPKATATAVAALHERWLRVRPTVLGQSAAVPLQRVAAERSMPLEVRVDALFCLSRFGSAAPVDAGLVVGVLQEKKLRGMMLTVLGTLRPRESRVRNAVASLLSSATGRERLIALETLSSFGDRRCVGPAVELVLRPGPWPARERAVRVLLRIGGDPGLRTRELERVLASASASKDPNALAAGDVIMLLLSRLVAEQGPGIVSHATLAIASARLGTVSSGPAALLARVALAHHDLELARKTLPELFSTVEYSPLEISLLRLVSDLACMHGMEPMRRSIVADVRQRLAESCEPPSMATSPEVVAALQKCLRRITAVR